MPTFSHGSANILPRLSQLITKAKPIYCQPPAKIQLTSCKEDESSLPPRLSQLITKFKPLYWQHPAKTQAKYGQWGLCHDTTHTLLCKYILLIRCRCISLLQLFTASNLPVLKIFVTDGKKYTGKLVLAFIASVRKQAPESIAVGKN